MPEPYLLVITHFWGWSPGPQLTQAHSPSLGDSSWELCPCATFNLFPACQRSITHKFSGVCLN